MDEFSKGWFNCLNAVAIELEADKSYDVQTSLINVLQGAGITLSEVREAQEMELETLNKSNVLVAYEGMLMEAEEQEEL